MLTTIFGAVFDPEAIRFALVEEIVGALKQYLPELRESDILIAKFFPRRVPESTPRGNPDAKTKTLASASAYRTRRKRGKVTVLRKPGE